MSNARETHDASLRLALVMLTGHADRDRAMPAATRASQDRCGLDAGSVGALR